MLEILQELVSRWAFLWDGGRHRISSSQVSRSFPYAFLCVESAAAELRFTTDRGDFYVEVRRRGAEEGARWLSLNWLEALLSGRQDVVPDRGVVASFYRDRLSEIEALLNDNAACLRVFELTDELAKAAADRLWGPNHPRPRE